MKKFIADFLATPVLLIIALVARFKRKKITIGIGPEPMINNVYHKRALKLYGYSCETFVVDTFFITKDFDRILKNELPSYLQRFVWYYSFIFAALRYDCLYMYFNGGPLFGAGRFMRFLEPYLLKLARVKTVLLAYGGDVSDTYTNNNLIFKNGLISHYPAYAKNKVNIQKQVDRWSRHANFIFSGCDWVDYTYHWDQLMLAHFSIDTNEWVPNFKEKNEGRLRVLHAPNHQLIKGTPFIIKAINELKQEGLDIELILLEKKPNEEVKRMMKEVDIVIDQLVIGWYAMFALEGMSSGKPVICFIRDDLKQLYQFSGLLQDELPLISADFQTIKSRLQELYNDRKSLKEIGRRSREYVQKYHSLEVIGNFFDEANKKIGLK